MLRAVLMVVESKANAACRRFLSLLVSGLLILGCAGSKAVAKDKLNSGQIEEINRLIYDYLMANPEVIVDSVQKLREQEEMSQREQGVKNLLAFRDQLENDPMTPVVGNPNGDITIVEFFDYRCGYCKTTLAVLRKLLAEDSGVRLVLKELPILSTESMIAARAALSADKQGKYFSFHNALMAARGSLDKEQVMEIAAQSGLDVEKLAIDMATPQVQAQVDANRELAANLNIRGTPTFVIGNQILPGAIDIDALRQIIEMMRAG
jgi:protein-disulfide isomerase